MRVTYFPIASGANALVIGAASEKFVTLPKLLHWIINNMGAKDLRLFLGLVK